jgi:hypothetical protein
MKPPLMRREPGMSSGIDGYGEHEMSETLKHRTSTRFGIPEPGVVVKVLLAVAVAMVVVSAIIQGASRALGGSELFGLVRLTYVDAESNIPTWYSSGLLLAVACIHAVIARAASRRADRWARHWWALAALFAVLSIDEASMIHELPIDRLRAVFGVGGLLHEAWVVPGMIAVMIVGLLLVSFLRSLPRSIAIGYLLAGVLFVGGAIGVEMVSGAVADGRGRESWMYVMVVSVEELFEMAGLAVLAGVSLVVLRNQVGRTVEISGSGAPGFDSAAKGGGSS